MTANLEKIGRGRDGGLYYIDDPAREASALKARDDYYTRDGGGIWKSSASTIVQDGALIDRASFQDLCAGINPATGSPAVRGAGAAHRAGWDLVTACGKSISLLWATGTPEQRTMLETLQSEAVAEALALLDREALLEARFGAGGRVKARPTDVVIGQFQHYTSREGDPHLHVHNVVMNVARCADGKTRTLDPERLFKAQLLIGAAFRSALAQRLVARGFQLEPAGQGQFEIAGFPPECLQAFSKRSKQVESIVKRSASAAQKQLAVLQTRRSKAELPNPEELQQRWREELAHFSVDPWLTAASLDHAPRPVQRIAPDLYREHAFEPPEVEGSGPVAETASQLFQTRSVITRNALLTAAFQNASLRGIGIDAVYAELNGLEREGLLSRLDHEHIGHSALPELGAAWTTPAIAACEARMLRAMARPRERLWIGQANLEAALEAAPHLSQEQREAVRLAANTDGVCLIEAGAGTGKTTLARVVVDAARASNLKVQALAPSWIAADEIATSIGIEARAIAKWRHELTQGPTPSLDADTLILVDEAGMVGTRDMEAILSAAAKHQCKVLLLGDRRQLASVPGANAIGAVADTLERQASLTEVRRQIVPWQRAASVLMARGDSEAGLRAYARQDRLELVDGEAAACDSAIKAWTEFRRTYGQDTLLITRKNKDAALLNKAARDVLRAEGMLISPDVLVPSINRAKDKMDLRLAVGDRVRFGESLPVFGIRNGTRAFVQEISRSGDGDVNVRFELDDGRVVRDRWSTFARTQVGRAQDAPRISHAYAGTAYAAQGRTVPAAVMYISEATDARETYVGLTRHAHDARIIVEKSRLDAALRSRQADSRIDPTEVAIKEALFVEAQRYAEKQNVIDFVEDREAFLRSGIVPIPRAAPALDVAKAARSARGIALHGFERETSLTLPALWKAIARMRLTVRGLAQPIARHVRSLLQHEKPLFERQTPLDRSGPDLGQ